jgi:hypothetical protein
MDYGLVTYMEPIHKGGLATYEVINGRLLCMAVYFRILSYKLTTCEAFHAR